MRFRRNTLCTLLAGVQFAATAVSPSLGQDAAVLPKHINEATQKAITKGLDALAKSQSPDGNWTNSNDGTTYGVVMASLAGMAFLANGNTPSRGPYAENIRRVESYVMGQARADGLICSARNSAAEACTDTASACCSSPASTAWRPTTNAARR
ncbi:MAG: hypothetical protein QM754_09615 [Tepidisphaeraceae bacterium]